MQCSGGGDTKEREGKFFAMKLARSYLRSEVIIPLFCSSNPFAHVPPCYSSSGEQAACMLLFRLCMRIWDASLHDIQQFIALRVPLSLSRLPVFVSLSRVFRRWFFCVCRRWKEKIGWAFEFLQDTCIHSPGAPFRLDPYPVLWSFAGRVLQLSATILENFDGATANI